MSWEIYDENQDIIFSGDNYDNGGVIIDENFFTPGAMSIIDFFLHDNLVFVSYVNESTGYKH